MGVYFCKLFSFKKEETKIFMQGLDGAGKTTILYLLKLGETVTTIPTIGFNVETVHHKNISLTAWDVGGRDKIRPLFRHYYPSTKAMVFVIDSADQDRLDVIADELMKCLIEPELRDAIFLILANKQDLESAMSVDEIKAGLNYDKIKADYSYRSINIFGCSAVTEEGHRGLYAALDWLCDELCPPVSGWWFSRPEKSVQKNSSVEGIAYKDVNKTEGEVEKKTEETDTEKVISDKSENEKTPWTLGSYLKGTLVSLRSALPNL